MKLLLLSDEKPGHLTSSRGIAQHLPNTVVIELPIRFRSKQRDNQLRMQARLWMITSPSDGRLDRWLRRALTSESYHQLTEHHRVDAVLSTGSSVAAVNLCWARILGIPALACRRPSPLGIRHFDKVVLPRYQWPRRPRENVIQTLGIPNQITPARLVPYRPRDKQLPCIGVLIGGEDKYFSFPPELAEAYAQALVHTVESLGITFALTPSRRTLPEAERLLKDRLGNHEACAMFIPVHTREDSQEAREAKPSLLALMAMSDVLLVTEDSYSMVCEALSSGRPVVLLQTARRRRIPGINRPIVPRRNADFQVMAEHHCLLTADPTTLPAQVERALALGWPQPPLRDAERAAREIAEWLEVHGMMGP